MTDDEIAEIREALDRLSHAADAYAAVTDRTPRSLKAERQFREMQQIVDRTKRLLREDA